MNQIAQILNSTLSSRHKSPMSEKILSPKETTPEPQIRCGSWSSKMLYKVRQCRDALKEMITFEKTPVSNDFIRTSRITNVDGQRGPTTFVTPRKMTSSSSVPDIVTSSRISRIKAEEERIVLRNSSLNSKETDSHVRRENIAKSMPLYDADETRASLNYFYGNNSLNSFLALEKQILEECKEKKTTTEYEARRGALVFETEEVNSLNDLGSVVEIDGRLEKNRDSLGKKRISAEPFISYTQGCAEILWNDDVEESLPIEDSSSLEQMNFSNIVLGDPCQSSTFCEDSTNDIQDSGIGNNLSTLRETI